MKERELIRHLPLSHLQYIESSYLSLAYQLSRNDRYRSVVPLNDAYKGLG